MQTFRHVAPVVVNRRGPIQEERGVKISIKRLRRNFDETTEVIIITIPTELGVGVGAFELPNHSHPQMSLLCGLGCRNGVAWIQF